MVEVFVSAIKRGRHIHAALKKKAAIHVIITSVIKMKSAL